MGLFDWFRNLRNLSGIRRVKIIDKIELNDRLSNVILELVVDTSKKQIYHVHPEMGHVETVAYILGIKKTEVSTFNAGNFVSVLIEITGNIVNRVIVGNSSLERNVKHTHRQKAIAEVLVNRLIESSLKYHYIQKAA